MNVQLSKLESWLAGVFKDAPKIPENGRKMLVQWLPWVALVGGIFQVIAAYRLWDLGRQSNEFIAGINDFARAVGAEIASELNVFYWFAVIFVLVSGVMLLMAYPGLKEKKKAGWNWLFCGVLLNIVYGVLAIFFDGYYGGGFGRFLGAFIGSLVGFWLLFQVRSYYDGARAAHKDTATK